MSAALPQAYIVVVHDEPEAHGLLESLLHRRLERDYGIVCEQSPERALTRLRALCDAELDVALILAAQGMRAMTGTEFLGKSQALYPHAKRAVLIGLSELGNQRDEILRAAAVGQIDTYILQPAREPDEAFYYAVGQFLEEWDRNHRPQSETLRLVGDQWDPAVSRLRDALERSGVPTGFYAHDSDAGRGLLAAAGLSGPLPVVIGADGSAIAQPTAAQIAGMLGVNVDPSDHDFDVSVVGAGPAGLAAAVYAASEGLDVLVIDSEALGGQASTTTAVRNYLGFPRGLKGSELAVRAYWQAWFFGARFLIGREASALRADGEWRLLELDDGTVVRSKGVVLASGVAYRRLGVPSVEAFVGRGVFYGAPVTEAPAMLGEHVVVIGGGNSSAQSALFLAEFASRVTLVVRRPALDEMSAYLLRDIEAHPRIDVRVRSVVEGAVGDTRLRSVTVHDLDRETREEMTAAAMFILIGAEPRTEWLPDIIERDERGYVVTGAEIGRPIEGDRLPFRLETSMPGVFAAGDVRAGSLKRIAAAVGEGSSVIRHVHEYLAELGHGHGH